MSFIYSRKYGIIISKEKVGKLRKLRIGITGPQEQILQTAVYLRVFR